MPRKLAIVIEDLKEENSKLRRRLEQTMFDLQQERELAVLHMETIARIYKEERARYDEASTRR